MVECDLAKVEVASSNLVSRSKVSRQKAKGKRKNADFVFAFYLFTFDFPSGRRSQVVRQRSAKPLFIGSIPIAASNPITLHEIPIPESHLQLAENRLRRYRENPSTAQPAFDVIDRLSQKSK